MVETPQTSGFTAATSEDKDGAVEDDPGPSFLHLLTEHDGWREIDGAEAAVRRVYDAAVAMLPDMLAGRDVSVVLSSDEAIAALNARYRGKNRPTNVLSFPAAPLTPGAGPIEGATGNPSVVELACARDVNRASCRPSGAHVPPRRRAALRSVQRRSGGPAPRVPS